MDPDLGFRPNWATLDLCRGRSFSCAIYCILDKLDFLVNHKKTLLRAGFSIANLLLTNQIAVLPICVFTFIVAVNTLPEGMFHPFCPVKDGSSARDNAMPSIMTLVNGSE